MCIVVTNENEDGSITLVDDNGDEVEQPNAHGKITAVLTDQDGGVRDVTWEWSKNATNNPGDDFDDIAGEAGNSYTPSNANEGDFLQVVATYRDRLIPMTDTTTRTAMATTKYSVRRGAPEGQPPVFMVDGVGVTSVNVEVAENSPSGTYVGAPLLAATDPDGDRPIYTLVDDDDTDDRDDTVFFELVMGHVDDDNDPETPAIDDDDGTSGD